MSAPAVVCLARTGLAVAREAAAAIGGELFAPASVLPGDGFDGRPSDVIRELFLAGRPVVGVCAAGILVRCLASCLGGKRSDPPVIAAAETGAFWIPLLGGHVGANALARRLADALGGRPVLTTASDLRFGLALDDPPEGWALRNPEALSGLTAKLLAGEGVALGGSAAGRADWLAGLPRREGAPDLMVGAEPSGDLPALVPKCAALGVGCVRGCRPEELIALADGTLHAAGLSPDALAGVFSVDLKADEEAVVAVAGQYGAPARFFTPGELESQAPRVRDPSAIVFREVGCHSVAEAAALAGAGPDGSLRVGKQKSASATCALAVAPEPILDLAGRGRGRLFLVSIGPGCAAWRTPEASRMIAEAEEVVGYGAYLDLVGPVLRQRPVKRFALGEEAERCRYALARAAEGRSVALVCSGDVGVYAMASLVWELVDREDAFRRVEVRASPGVTAANAAAARIGAPLGHDHCMISLSDLMTSREVILARVEAAARADFVISFYNPVSAGRRTLLPAARDVLLRHRPSTTPVAVARNLGRVGESLRHVDLCALRAEDADMRSVVLVGASTSRRLSTADGARMYTPRGYRSARGTGAAG